MANSLIGRVKSAWNAFMNRDPPVNVGSGSFYRPDRLRLTRGNERSIVTAVYNKLAIDAASMDIKHIELDENGRYKKTIDSHLNRCLNLFANKDQSARTFKHDVVLSLFDEGCIAIVPVDTTSETNGERLLDIDSLRVAKITQWYPDYVRLSLYNDRKGFAEEIILLKEEVVILENPFYTVMNEPNSTVSRLVRKLALLDMVDEQTSSGKLDLIVQVPYTIKTPAMQARADSRREQIEEQLANSKYGVVYTDGSERIVQLNRPIENKLLTQIETLTEEFYSHLGITKEIMNGTANEETMQNYYSRTIEPILTAIVEGLRWKFLRYADRSKESIDFFRDPFKLIPVTAIADIADKMTRNEIMSSNEIRQKIGMPPSDDPTADELRNKNLNQSKNVTENVDVKEDVENKNEG